MRNFARTITLSAALLLATPAAAQQDSSPPDPSQIVVTGTRDAERQIRDFVDALTPARVGGQLARYEGAVCPVALGFAPAQKVAIERRLRTVAEAIGLEAAPTGCTANALVMATRDKRAFLQMLSRRHPRFLGGMSSPAFRRLLAEPGPSAAWHMEGQLDADGSPLITTGEAQFPVNRTFRNPSRVTAAARPYFQAAALAVEAGALEGLSTTQLADYSAMRLFGRTDPSRLPTPSPSTILGVLGAPMGSEVPVTLTSWDLGFLRGLYVSQANLRAAAQRSEIARQVAQEVERSQASGD